MTKDTRIRIRNTRVMGFRLDPKLHMQAELAGVNIRSILEDNLKLAVDSTRAVNFKKFCRCPWCEEHKPVEELLAWCLCDEENQQVIVQAICKPCLNEMVECKETYLSDKAENGLVPHPLAKLILMNYDRGKLLTSNRIKTLFNELANASFLDCTVQTGRVTYKCNAQGQFIWKK